MLELLFLYVIIPLCLCAHGGDDVVAHLCVQLLNWLERLHRSSGCSKVLRITGTWCSPGSLTSWCRSLGCPGCMLPFLTPPFMCGSWLLWSSVWRADTCMRRELPSTSPVFHQAGSGLNLVFGALTDSCLCWTCRLPCNRNVYKRCDSLCTKVVNVFKRQHCLKDPVLYRNKQKCPEDVPDMMVNFFKSSNTPFGLNKPQHHQHKNESRP